MFGQLHLGGLNFQLSDFKVLFKLHFPAATQILLFSALASINCSVSSRLISNMLSQAFRIMGDRRSCNPQRENERIQWEKSSITPVPKEESKYS